MAWRLVTNPFLIGFFRDQKRERVMEKWWFCAHFSDAPKELSEKCCISLQLGNLLFFFVI